MDYEKEYSCVEKNEKVFSKSIDIEQDYSESIPEYCDDIYRVVKCKTHSFISSASISSNEILIIGKTEIMLTYYNENSCLCYADFDEEFTRKISSENLSDYAFAYAEICDKYSNFRIINQRRIDVHSSSTVSLAVYDKVKYPCLTGCKGAKLNKQRIISSDIIGFNISKIEFDEEFPLPSASSPIKRIVSTNSIASIEEIKIIKEKALIKAEMQIDILYTVDDESIQNVRNTISLTKIIDCTAIDDGDIAIGNVTVGNVFQKAKANTGDMLDAVEVFGDIEVSTLFIRESENVYLTDGYIPKRKSECSYSDKKIISGGSSFNESTLFNVSVDVSSAVNEIKEVGVYLSPPIYRNNKLVSKAEVLTLYDNDNGALSSVSSSSELEYDISGFDNAFGAFNLKSVDYTIAGAKRIDLRLNVDVNGYLYHESSIKLLTDIEEGEEIDSPSITICFAKQNDKVWDIAKSFSSDEELIIKENNLQSNIIDNDSILIIPRV